MSGDVVDRKGHRSNVVGKNTFKPHFKGALASLPNVSATGPNVDCNGHKINSHISHNDVKNCGESAREYEKGAFPNRHNRSKHANCYNLEDTTFCKDHSISLKEE